MRKSFYDQVCDQGLEYLRDKTRNGKQLPKSANIEQLVNELIKHSATLQLESYEMQRMEDTFDFLADSQIVKDKPIKWNKIIDESYRISIWVFSWNTALNATLSGKNQNLDDRRMFCINMLSKLPGFDINLKGEGDMTLMLYAARVRSLTPQFLKKIIDRFPNVDLHAKSKYTGGIVHQIDRIDVHFLEKLKLFVDLGVDPFETIKFQHQSKTLSSGNIRFYESLRDYAHSEQILEVEDFLSKLETSNLAMNETESILSKGRLGVNSL